MALTLVADNQDVDTDAAQREAYGIVADGYARAAEVPGLDVEEHARVVRCLRKANVLAGREDGFRTVEAPA